ncbi:hypothetical protein niasHT_024067 [Heterodera trifolii]|uniref:Uncharacterized protein n=1 Tax=Heterodera trifolii TaxID=157864 RepID=A0ABD2JYR7_9BILA
MTKRPCPETAYSPISQKNGLHQLIDSQLTFVKTTVEALKQLETSFTSDQMPIFTTLISTLSSQIDLLSGSFSQLHSTAQSNEGMPISAEELERQRSIVIIGLPEHNDDSPAKRAEMDRTKINGIFDSLGIECGTISYRMGRSFNPAQRSPRPLKVLLPSRGFQKQALSAWQKKHNTIRPTDSSLKNVRLRESLTKAQLEERRCLHLQCVENRKKDGKDWIVYAGTVILRDEVQIFRSQNIRGPNF